MQPIFDAQNAQLLMELLDPIGALEVYDKAYTQFRHLFYAYDGHYEMEGLWDGSNSGEYGNFNRQMFLKASLRLSETKMRVRRHADNDPTVLQRADELKATVDETWHRDEDQFLNQLF